MTPLIPFAARAFRPGTRGAAGLCTWCDGRARWMRFSDVGDVRVTSRCRRSCALRAQGVSHWHKAIAYAACEFHAAGGTMRRAVVWGPFGARVVGRRYAARLASEGVTS